jgi:nitrite reductase/ring-hydroxylating ferredoxin subunit
LSNHSFQIDPDITKASTPPSWVYTDPSFYEQTRQQVFARSWQFIGDVTDAKVPGQVHPFALLEGCLDERLLLVRDRDDRLYCMSNVCTHRGMLVCEEGGVEITSAAATTAAASPDGTFVSMPEFEGTVNFLPKPMIFRTSSRAVGTVLFAADPMYCSTNGSGRCGSESVGAHPRVQARRFALARLPRGLQLGPLL